MKAIVAAAVSTEIALLCAAGCLLVEPGEGPAPVVVIASSSSGAGVSSASAGASRAGVEAPGETPGAKRPRRPPYSAVELGFPYESLILEAARRHRLSPQLIAAMTRVESDFDHREISHKGARGLMQVMPATGARFGVEPEALFDPERNIAAGTAYLRWLLDRYQGDVDLALAGYNAGEGAVDKYGGIPPYRETQQYVRKVRAALASMKGDERHQLTW